MSGLSIESRIEVDKVSISLFKVLSIILIFNRGLMQIELRVTWKPLTPEQRIQGRALWVFSTTFFMGSFHISHLGKIQDHLNERFSSS